MAKKMKAVLMPGDEGYDSRLDINSPDYEPKMDPDNSDYDPGYAEAGATAPTSDAEESKEDKAAREKAEREARAEEKARANLEAAEREAKVKAQAEVDAEKERVAGGPPIKTPAGKTSNAELDADGNMIGSPLDANVAATGTEGASANNPKLTANETLSSGEPNPTFEKAAEKPLVA